MAAVLLICCCSCLLSSSGSSAFVAGVIPRTSPHFEKGFQLKKAKMYLDIANELRLLGMDIPDPLLASEDLTLKNSMIDIYTKIQEKSPTLCELHTEFSSDEFKEKLKEVKEYYEEEGRESILTFGGMKDWKEYASKYLEPTDDMKESYKNVTLSQSENCSLRSLDENKMCLPFTDTDIAGAEMTDTCTLLKETLELSPAALVDLILKEANTPDTPEASE